jgi:hypothetical protein
MANNVLTSFSMLNNKPNFDRDLFNTVSDMVAFSERRLPDIFIASVKETGKTYKYTKTNEVDPVLGKWREFGVNAEETFPFPEIIPSQVEQNIPYYLKSVVDPITNEASYVWIKIPEDFPAYESPTDGSDDSGEYKLCLTVTPNTLEYEWVEANPNISQFTNDAEYLTATTLLTSEPYLDLVEDIGNNSTNIKTNADAIDVLNGTGEGSVDKKISQAIAALSNAHFEIVTELPADIETADTSAIYLIEDNSVVGVNKYMEWIVVTNKNTGNKEYICIGDTSVDLSAYAKIENLSTVATSGSYNDLTDVPEPITKVSELENDSGYLTNDDIDIEGITDAINEGLKEDVNVIAVNSINSVVPGNYIGCYLYDLSLNRVYYIEGEDGIVSAMENVTAKSNIITMSLTSVQYSNLSNNLKNSNIIFFIKD